jgi:IS605 OrfB family transposase
MGEQATVTRALKFWVRDIAEEDFAALHELANDLGRCHRHFTEASLRYVFDGGSNDIERRQVARRAFKDEFGQTAWLRDFAHDYCTSLADKDFKRQWGLIKRGRKSSVCFGPGKANVEFSVGRLCQVVREGDEWVMRDVALRVGETAGARGARRWALKPQVTGSRASRARRAAERYRDLERATKVSLVRLVWRPQGWEGQVVVTVPARQADGDEEVVCGVDVGMHHLLVASIPGKRRQWWFGSRQAGRLWEELDRAGAARSAIARAGNREAKRFRSDRCGRLRKHLTELASRGLVDECAKARVAVIRMERLTGIRERALDDDVVWNRRLSHWPWYNLQQRIEQKAQAAGIRVEYVRAAGTSQRCSACGFRDERNREGPQFRCLSCGFECHSDLNAANNIALGKETMPHTRPTGPRFGGRGRDAGLSGNEEGTMQRLIVSQPALFNPEPCAQGGG